MTVVRALPLLLFAALTARADLDAVKAEPNLEKRSEKALDHATKLVAGLRERYTSGGIQAIEPMIGEIGDAVDLARTSLEETGKRARRSPKYFKRAEQKTRDLARRLDSVRQEIDAQDREPV